MMKIDNEVLAKVADRKINIDSRLINNGEVFVAIAGETYDGHDFIDDAINKGATFVIAKKGFFNKSSSPKILLVDDPLSTYQALASIHLSKFSNLKKIAITGSNGKTTTKEMIKAALSQVFGKNKVYASSGNKNNHIGVPQSAFEVGPEHEIAIFEMGMNHPNEIATLCNIVEPHFGLITNISFAHEGNFVDGIVGIQKAKAELFEYLANSKIGHCVVNIDDERVAKEASIRHFHALSTFGTSNKAKLCLSNKEPFCSKKNSQTLSIKVADGSVYNFSIPIPGAHHAANALAAMAMAYAVGVSLKEAALGISHMPITKGRMQLINGIDECKIVHDGYNANPISMQAGILATKEMPANRRIAVIGSMGELGQKSAEHHFELGENLSSHFHMLFICGQYRHHILEGVKKKGLINEENIYSFASSKEIIEPLLKTVAKNDLIFIKGSFSQNMQVVVDALASKP